MFLLHVAAEVEHELLAQYLYSAYAIRTEVPEQPGAEATLRAWKETLHQIAREEMGHLLTLQNILRLLGAPLHFDRSNLSRHAELHPFPLQFEPFTRGALAKYVLSEKPRDTDEDLSALEAALGDACPGRERVHRVGRIYARLNELFEQIPESECSPDAVRWMGTAAQWRGSQSVRIFQVTSLADARAALEFVALQGEGLYVSPDAPSHFERFLAMFRAWPDGLVAARPVPTYDGALPTSRVLGLADARDWADLFDLQYRQLLLVLSHALQSEPDDAGERGFLVGLSFELMAILGSTAEQLVRMPREPGRTAAEAAAAPLFELPLSIDLPDRPVDRWREHLSVAEQLQQLIAALIARGAPPPVLESLSSRVVELRSLLRVREQHARPGPGLPVVIIGAGPAGLSAAQALTSRGVPVQLLEAGPFIGGKVTSHHEGGRSLEHGVHGWWMNYRNFDRLMDWSDIDREKALRVADGSNLLLADGQLFPLRRLPFDLPSPLFLAWQVVRAPYLSFRDMLQAVRFFGHALAFEHARDYDAYDAFSFRDLTRHSGVSKAFCDRILDPFILSFDFATPDRVSAACGLSGMEFYILPDQDSILARWARGLPDDVIFGPIRQKLLSSGAALRVASPVEGVDLSAGRVTSVRVGTANGGPVIQKHVALADVPRTGYARVRGTLPLWLGREGGELRAIDGTCPHAGCPVHWEDEPRRFVCPCHGSTFDDRGEVVRGPATSPLARRACHERGGEVVIDVPAGTERVACRDVIVATDVEAAKRLVAGSPGAPDELTRRLSLMSTNPVIVVRLWFDTSASIPRPIESAVASGFKFIDNFFDLTKFHPPIRQEGYVVEVQSYRVDDYVDVPDQAILDQVMEDLRVLHPGLTPALLRHHEINRHLSVFTRYAPGQERDRPDTTTPVPGLFLAGDWVRSDSSVWMMERAVVSGLRAANAVLRARGIDEVEVLALPKPSRTLRFARWIARRARDAGLLPLPRPPDT